MHIFVSAGEPSGDLHGSNLIRAIQQQCRNADFSGLGGDKMTAAGANLLYPLADHPFIGFVRVAKSVPFFWGLLNQVEKHFRSRRPDVVVLIDNPGLNWWIAASARKFGIPVLYFVPPQIWAWAGWRVGKMRRLVDRVLCNLPFEKDWYQQRGVQAQWIGHPYFDELLHQQTDSGFLQEQRAKPGRIVGLLPGSRNQELENNGITLIRAAEIIHRQHPDARFLVACFKDKHRKEFVKILEGRGLPVEAHVGRTAEIIELSHSTISVSGSVGLELLYRATPSVVTYRTGKYILKIARLIFIRCKFISLVNLLADKELFPEFLSHRCEATALAGKISDWLANSRKYEECRAELIALRDRVAIPGACGRAAAEVLQLVNQQARAAA